MTAEKLEILRARVASAEAVCRAADTYIDWIGNEADDPNGWIEMNKHNALVETIKSWKELVGVVEDG